MGGVSGRLRRWKWQLGNSRQGIRAWMRKQYGWRRHQRWNEKLWPTPPSNEQLPAARAHIHRGFVKPCPEQTFDGCPTQSRPLMWNALPVAHAPSLPGATRFFVLGFTNFKWGFVAARHNDGAKSTSCTLPLFSHDWCTNFGPLPISMEIHQWQKLCLGG